MYLQSLIEDISNFIRNSPHNFVEDLDMMQIWDDPLIGIAEVSDPLWENLKDVTVVGPHHLSPTEWLKGSKSVISYYLPFTESIRDSNRSENIPSKEWLYGRYEGEIFNNELRRLIIELVESKGGNAIAPALDERFAVKDHNSNWSERHVAFIAGLGTFGLSRSLITNLGTAGRFGSVIVDLEFEPKKRPYTEVDEYCNKCGACMNRCPAQAITEKGKDKASCFKYLLNIFELNKPRYACGKCQTATPCEYKKP